MNDKSVAPVGFEEGTWEGIVEDIHLLRDAVGSHSNIVNSEPVLVVKGGTGEGDYFPDHAGIRSVFIVVGIDVVVAPWTTPALPIGGTVDARCCAGRGVGRTKRNSKSENQNSKQGSHHFEVTGVRVRSAAELR
jgi:hypothetical protein